MRKLLLSAFLILGITMFLGFVSAECTDTDGGQSFYEKGETAVTAPGYTAGGSQVPSGNTGYSFDNCFQNTLSEAVCVNDNSEFVEYKCPNECFDGFCLKDNENGYVLTEKNELTASLGNKNYIISINSISTELVQLKISGDLEEITKTLSKGESQTLSNGFLIKVTDMDAIRMYGTPASVTFTISDSTVQNQQPNNNIVNYTGNNVLLYGIIGGLISIILIILFFVLRKRK